MIVEHLLPLCTLSLEGGGHRSYASLRASLTYAPDRFVGDKELLATLEGQ